MKFDLVKDQNNEFAFNEADPGPTKIKLWAKISPSRMNVGPAKSIYDKFRKAFHRIWGHEEWSLYLAIIPTIDPALVDVQVSGVILEAVQYILYSGDDHENLDLRVKLSSTLCKTDGDLVRGEPVYVTGMRPINEDSILVNHRQYITRNVKFPEHPGPGPDGMNFIWRSWRVQVEVSGTKDFIFLSDILPTVSATTRIIYQTKKYCDFEIVSESGRVFPCHRSFLCAKSTVLAAKVDEHSRNGKVNRMEMVSMSDDSIEALLLFIYCDSVTMAFKSSVVAVELLKAAGVYDMPMLWSAMTRILTEKPYAWFDVDVALTLFDFAGNCERLRESAVKKNMLKVLACKRSLLAASPLFDEMFPSAASKELFCMALETNRP